MIPTSILAAQIVISLKSKTTPNIKSKNINVTTNINKSRFLSITFFSFTPPTQTSTAHTSTFIQNYFLSSVFSFSKFWSFDKSLAYSINFFLLISFKL